MKTINNFIAEKLNLGKAKTYTCQPQTKKELRNILEERLAENKNANLNDIDVSEITDMGFMKDDGHGVGLFENLDPHNIDISEWDVSNVENMISMFWTCRNFNCDLSNWDVSSCKDMANMFCGCINFNSDLSKWNVLKVEDMHNMFVGCTHFNSDLSKWNVSNVKDVDDMFLACSSLKKKPKWYKYKK